MLRYFTFGVLFGIPSLGVAEEFGIKSLLPKAAYSIKHEVLVKGKVEQLAFKFNTLDEGGSFEEDVRGKLIGKLWRGCKTKNQGWSEVASLYNERKRQEKIKSLYFVKMTAMIEMSFVLTPSGVGPSKKEGEVAVSISYVDFSDKKLITERIADFGLSCDK